MFINNNVILYAGIKQIIDRKTAIILEQNEHGVFLQDTLSQAYMIATDDIHQTIAWLEKHEYLHYQLCVVFQDKAADFIKKKYQLTECLECYQAVYLPNNIDIHSTQLQIKKATKHDLPIIQTYYHRLEECELVKIIEKNQLFLGYYQSQLIGFIGMHLEGSMGLLEVFPQYRKRGFGRELEKYMIAYILEQKLIPYCQVETDNEKSLLLQQKLGLTISKEKVYWLF